MTSGPRLGGWRSLRLDLAARGITARAVTFTSQDPGSDLARLAREQDVSLILLAAPAGRTDDERVVALLEQASCDVAVHVAGAAGAGPIAVPFAGADHDWAAVELGARVATATGVRLRLVGTAADGQGRDASRLLASASLAVQRALGIAADPVLVESSPDAVLAATRDARLVVVGLPSSWRSRGLGSTRGGLAESSQHATLFVRAGPGAASLSVGNHTRFTWTLHSGL